MCDIQVSSEWFYNELSADAKSYCRMVDRICVVGSKIPMEIWTVDVFNYGEGVVVVVVVCLVWKLIGNGTRH